MYFPLFVISQKYAEMGEALLNIKYFEELEFIKLKLKFEFLFCVYLAKIFGINKMSMKNKKKQLNTISQIHLKSKRLARIEEILEEIVNELNEEHKNEMKQLEWKLAALVLDRLFFYLSIVYFLLTFFPIIL